MKRSFAISLVLAAIATISAACSGPPELLRPATPAPTVDVEATVQARLREERTTTPTATPQPEPMTETAAAGKLLPSVVRVSTDIGMGSGVVIGDGLVITNRHVIEDKSTVSVQPSGGRTLTGKVTVWNTILDLALIQVPGLTAPAASFADVSAMKPAAPVLAIGYPLDLKGDATVTRGLFSAVRVGEPLPGEWVQTDAAVNPGNSGGPLANLRGEVLGLITLKRASDNLEPVQGINFALSASLIKETLPAMLLSTGSMPQGATPLDPATSAEVADFLQKYDDAETRAFSTSDPSPVRELSTPAFFSFTSAMVELQKTLNIHRESTLLDFKLLAAYSLPGDMVVADVFERWRSKTYRGSNLDQDEGDTDQPQVVVAKRSSGGWQLAAVQFRQTGSGTAAKPTPTPIVRPPAPRPTMTPPPGRRSS